jgi:hypothetical protein
VALLVSPAERLLTHLNSAVRPAATGAGHEQVVGSALRYPPHIGHRSTLRSQVLIYVSHLTCPKSALCRERRITDRYLVWGWLTTSFRDRTATALSLEGCGGRSIRSIKVDLSSAESAIRPKTLVKKLRYQVRIQRSRPHDNNDSFLSPLLLRGTVSCPRGCPVLGASEKITRNF